jgi:hypothetical protein
LRGHLANRYKKHYEDENNLANEWWEKFNSLNGEQMEVVKSIVAKNRFADEDFNTNDPAILEVFKYYKVKQDKRKSSAQ